MSTIHDELVLANSRLAIISVLAGTIAAPFATSILKVLSAPWVLRTGSLVFVLGALVCARRSRVPKRSARRRRNDDRDALHAPSIVLAGTAMALLRGAVGFFTFFAAFALKRSHEPAWMFGIVIIGSAIGAGIGIILAPFLRKKLREEWMLAGSLLVPAVPLLIAARQYTRDSLVFAAVAVAAGAACGRVAFDSLLQRDGAEAARGRAFARFETRFQLVWVAGGVIAVLFPGGGRGGIFLVALVMLFAGLSYIGGFRRTATRKTQAPAAPPALEPGRADRDPSPRP